MLNLFVRALALRLGRNKTVSIRRLDMPGGGMEWQDTLLFVLTTGLVGVFFLAGVIGAAEAWRHWSYNREIRKHFRN
jgi:hypothetical protein